MRTAPEFLHPIILSLVVFFAGVAEAQEPDVDGFVRFLAPVAVQEGFGGHGTQWEAHLWAYNGGEEHVSVDALPESECVGILCPLPPVEPGKVGYIQLAHAFPFGGAFFYVEAEGEEFISFSMRARDANRNSEDAGTEIPIVGPSDVEPGKTVDLIRIPCDNQYRRLLRIYSFDAAEIGVVVRTVASQSGQLLQEQFVLLRTAAAGYEAPYEVSTKFPPHPPYAQLDIPSSLCTEEYLRIAIMPSSSEDRLWAMVTLTNNVTQHVTLVTPQP